MITDRDALVTVGIPTYNRPEGLQRTLEAIAGQSYRNLEIIVSDNCSTDPNVRKIVETYLLKDARVRYHRHDSNIGAISNFFSLLDLAQGDYFMWAADDDWWDQDFVEVSVESLQNHPSASVALTRFQPLPDPSGKIRKVPPSFDKIKAFEKPIMADRLETYILQRDTFGKAHVIYGMFPLPVLKHCTNLLKSIVEPVMPVGEFYRMDVFLNAIILTQGELVTSEPCLRRYNYEPRGGGHSVSRVLRGFDPHFHAYVQFMLELISRIEASEQVKQRLRRSLRLRKWLYYLERIGRKLIVYRIYWSLYKRMAFDKR